MDPDERLRQFGSATFTTLRPLQREALIGATLADASVDLAVELPTGYGKTLVGLLLAADAMDRGQSAVYLTFSRQLANQVAQEASELGLPTEVMASPLRDVGLAARRRVNRGEALGVMNYWAYLLDVPVVEPPAILLLDDAHLAESPLSGRFALTVRRLSHPQLFTALLNLISERAPGYAAVDDAVMGVPDPATRVELLAFPHVGAIADAARGIFEPHIAGVPDLSHPYRRIAHTLERCLWLVGPDSIQVRPIRYPLDIDPPFADSGRRVYLSATLANLTDLRRRLGVPRVSKLSLTSAHDALPGNRMLVAFDTEPDETAKSEVRAALCAATPRAVWFCPSLHEASQLVAQRHAIGRNVVELDREGANLESFVTARILHERSARNRPARCIHVGQFPASLLSGLASSRATNSGPWADDPRGRRLGSNRAGEQLTRPPAHAQRDYPVAS